MTTNAGAIAVVVEADTASFESSMSKVGASAERELKRAEKASASAKAEGDRFVAMLQRQVDSFGLTGTALLAYEARLKGVSAQAQPLIDKLNAMKAAQQAINQQATSGALSNVGRGMKEAANAAEGAAHGTAGITRELLVLGHEASQGNFKRFGGSLLVLAEYSTKAQAAIAAMAGPVGLVVAGLGLFALAAFQGARQADELRKSLILTGNFAGTTAGQFELLSKSIAASTSTTVGKASAALQALVSTGEVGPKLLGDMAAATVKLEALTGKSADEIAKDFVKLQEAPAKWAAEANKAYNFLTVAQYEHIRSLTEMGRNEEAAIEVLARLNEHIGTQVPESLTYLGKALHEAGLAWDKFWHAAVHEGAPQTVQDQIDTIDKRLAYSRALRDDHTLLVTDVGSVGPAGMADLQEQRRLLQGVARNEKDLALATAERAKAQKDGIAASDYFTALDHQDKGVNRLKKDLEELDAMERKRATARVADGQAAVQPGDDADHAARVAAIRHRDRSSVDRTDESFEKTIKARLELYDQDIAKLRDEAAQYTMFGKVLDKTAEAMIRVEMAQGGKYAKASPADKAALLAKAQADDQAEAFKKEAEASAAAAKQREKDDAALTKHLQDSAIATQIEIEKLQEDTKYLSLNTLERRIASEALKIEKQRRDELADPKNAGREDDINNSAAQRTRDITKALTEADAEQKSFGYGSQKAFAQYSAAANDASKFSENFISGSLAKMTDALTTFAETGKLSFKSLIDSMIKDLIRFEIQKALSSAFGGGASGNGSNQGLSTLFSFFGSNTGSGADSASFANLFSSGFGGAAYAGGIDSVPYNGMPAVLHEGERVMTRIENQRSKSGGDAGHTVHITNNNSFGAGVNASQLAQALETTKAQTKADIMRSIKTGKAAA